MALKLQRKEELDNLPLKFSQKKLFMRSISKQVMCSANILACETSPSVKFLHSMVDSFFVLL